MSDSIRLLSGGAAQGLVGQLKGLFQTQSGLEVQGTFGAVGAMRDMLLAGAPCDVLILTQALIEQLARDGDVAPGSSAALGVVKTGVAVKSGEQAPPMDTAPALRSALLGAKGIYFPDPVKATAGIHFMKVLKTLGIAEQLTGRLRPFPNGASAMREMAQCTDKGLIGCTQVTEILYTPGVQLTGLLPVEFELATVYTAALCSRATQPEAARQFIAMMAGAYAAKLRAEGGFEVA